MNPAAEASTLGLMANLIWAIGGLFLGYLGGLAVGFNRQAWQWSGTIRIIMGLLILTLVATGAVLNLRLSTRLLNAVECQRDFNITYRGALAAQLDAAAQDSKAQRAFLAAVRSQPVPQQVRDKAFDDYTADLDSSDRLRAAHPLPDANLCKGS